MPKGIRKVPAAANGVIGQQKSLLSYFTNSPNPKSSPLTTFNRESERNAKELKEDDILTKKDNKEDRDRRELEKMENYTNPTTPPSSKRIKLKEGDSTSHENSGSDNQSSSELSVVAPLTPEQKTIVSEKATTARLLKMSRSLMVLDPDIGTTWFSALENEFKKDYFMELNNHVMVARNRGTVYPPANNVFEWTKQCRIQDVKVVILGQDPYHGPNQAHGLCFSVKKGVPPPPSLVNMYKELLTDVEGFKRPNHGCLTGWAEQGVLLLNAVLTVDTGKANSHKDKGWEKVTDAVISWISKNLDSVVFLLWGAYAQKKGAIVDKKKHHLLQTVHPSPLSAHRGFLGCKHFSKCNELLTQDGKQPVDWNHLP